MTRTIATFALSVGLFALACAGCEMEVGDAPEAGDAAPWIEKVTGAVEYFSVCEDYCLECAEVHRCGRTNELRLHCVSGGSGCAKPTPIACMCCAPNACRKGTIRDGVCEACPDGQLCDDLTNECYTPESTVPPPEPACLWPEKMCDGVCTNVRNNRNHCGSCDNKCAWNQVCDVTRCVGGGVIPR